MIPLNEIEETLDIIINQLEENNGQEDKEELYEILEEVKDILII